MPSDLIYREDAKDYARHAMAKGLNVLEYLDEVPAADFRPVVRGKRIVKEMQALFPGMDEHPVFACSECGCQIYDLLDNVKERHHFCPNCGADMREES